MQYYLAVYIIINIVLQDKHKIGKASNFKRFRNIVFIMFYYVLITGISILISRAIFFITTAHGVIYNDDPFAESLAGGVVAILAFNTILFRKIFSKSIKNV